MNRLLLTVVLSDVISYHVTEGLLLHVKILRIAVKGHDSAEFVDSTDRDVI